MKKPLKIGLLAECEASKTMEIFPRSLKYYAKHWITVYGKKLSTHGIFLLGVSAIEDSCMQKYSRLR